jgi:hypothetical protein
VAVAHSTAAGELRERSFEFVRRLLAGCRWSLNRWRVGCNIRFTTHCGPELKLERSLESRSQTTASNGEHHHAPQIILLALLLTTSGAYAQSFNVDYGVIGSPNPPVTYRAAASQPGHWNGVFPGAAVILFDLAGVASGVTLTPPLGGTFAQDNPLTTGDDELLLDDIADVNTPTSMTLSGLADGKYTIYTYAWAPDNDLFLTNVDVPGSSDPLQTVGGPYPGTHALGVTYAMHHIDVIGGAAVVIDLLDTDPFLPDTCNGFQIVMHDSLGTPMCFGDGTADAGLGPVDCPCNNNTPVGDDQGCQHSLGYGAKLTPFGSASWAADDLSFMVDLAIPGQTAVLIQGASPIAMQFKDGILCTGTPTERVEFFSLDAQGVGFTTGSIVTNGNVPGPGSSRIYQAWFRNPGGVSPCGTGSNLTHAVMIDWI